ncbi:DUF5666 domain-containing protein [Roseicella sp. DB1501]|uniref:DUF5666 domain-containing protein n=1 Tax=Roseicella sp. DB1501 TaxID=2730925 RepID=UPI001491A8FA|nr:hypothetical protein [Roseicella sp. DB1501]
MRKAPVPPAEALRRHAARLLLALLAGCTPPAPPAAPPVAASATGGVCRTGPDGGPPPDTLPPRLAERGIGGTGIGSTGIGSTGIGSTGIGSTGIGSTGIGSTGIGSTGIGSTGIGSTGIDGAAAEGDRGIGGTGAPPIRQADRGIGGTGIVAVITGFASICLGGQEVALEAGLPVLLDGVAAAPDALRAGQVALVEAAGPGRALRAQGIRIRHEVSGPVEAVGTDGLLRVAGQRVAVTPSTLGLAAPRPGDWVAVSGLPRPDGVVQATRLDPRRPGPVTVHGRLARDGDGWRVGGLAVHPAGAAGPVLASVPFPFPVSVSGRYAGGALRAAAIAPDPLATDPAALFPPGTGRILFEGYAIAEGGRLRLGPGLALAAPPGGAALLPGRGPERVVVALERLATGDLRATGLRSSGSEVRPGEAQPGGSRPGPAGDAPMRPGPDAMSPAPMPNRSLGLDGAGGVRGGWDGGFGAGTGSSPGSSPGSGAGLGGPGGQGGAMGGGAMGGGAMGGGAMGGFGGRGR